MSVRRYRLSCPDFDCFAQREPLLAAKLAYELRRTYENRAYAVLAARWLEASYGVPIVIAEEAGE